MFARQHSLVPKLFCAILGFVVFVAAGCRGDRTDEPPRQFFPGLDDQPKFKVQGETDFFPDGRTMRKPPAHVVAFGRSPVLSYGSTAAERAIFDRIAARSRADLLRGDDRVYRGLNPDGSFVERIPLREVLSYGPDEAIDAEELREFIALGAERYNIFCAACHGGLGDGQGAVGKLWSAPLPSYHQEQYRPGGEKGQDGLIFSRIRNGVANTPGQLPELKMPSYARQLNEYESWAIVAYFRVLQKSQNGSIDDVPAAQRESLMRTQPAPTQGGGV